MIDIRPIDAQGDVRLPNEPFRLFGRMLPSFRDGVWGYELLRFPEEAVTEMCFPEEDYDPEAMADSVFLGAYDGDRCVGLAVLQPGWFKYMYLSDLKVLRRYRGQHIGTRLIEAARQVAADQGYCGLYTLAQDNNPGACLFYLHTGFRIGGLDTEVYRHTRQEGKADIVFCCDH